MWNSENEFTGTNNTVVHLVSGNQTACVAVVAAESSPLGQARTLRCGGGGGGSLSFGSCPQLASVLHMVAGMAYCSLPIVGVVSHPSPSSRVCWHYA